MDHESEAKLMGSSVTVPPETNELDELEHIADLRRAPRGERPHDPYGKAMWLNSQRRGSLRSKLFTSNRRKQKTISLAPIKF